MEAVTLAAIAALGRCDQLSGARTLPQAWRENNSSFRAAQTRPGQDWDGAETLLQPGGLPGCQEHPQHQAGEEGETSARMPQRHNHHHAAGPREPLTQQVPQGLVGRSGQGRGRQPRRDAPGAGGVVRAGSGGVRAQTRCPRCWWDAQGRGGGVRAQARCPRCWWGGQGGVWGNSQVRCPRSWWGARGGGGGSPDEMPQELVGRSGRGRGGQPR